jgi:myosin heavy subunit
MHTPGDHVYVRDTHYEWLPAVVEEVHEENDQVLVRIDLPKDWKTTTLLHPNDAYKKRWISLQDYNDHVLPLQNSIQCRDMAELTHLHEAEILYQVKQRHCVADKPYTRVGDIMVAMNPCRWIHSLYSVEQQNFYFEHFGKPNPKENSGKFDARECILSAWGRRSLISQFFPATDTLINEEEKKDSLADDPAFVDAGTLACSGRDYDRLGCEPHIYEVSSLAFRGLVEYQMNQTILVSGESGSGKTETVKLVLKHIASLRPSRSSVLIRKYDDDLISHVLASSPIFESFGNAKTLFNANSSRFGKVTQLYFSTADHGASLIGSSFSSYLLELNRVVSHAEGERNFHIFYQMLSAPSEVKNELLGPDWREATPADFRYLRNSQSGIKEEMLDASNWLYTLKALIMFGWDGFALEQLMRALGVVLLVGNIEFQEENENKASIVQEADLFMLSASIGVPVEELELALTQRTIQTAQDLLLVPFSPDQANEACEALSKAIYAGVVASIVRQINYLTSLPPSLHGNQNSIALVDIFGFENYESNNRFDQFCINFANERLQQKYVFDNIRRHVNEYELEGIVLPDLQDIDNSSTVYLFEGPSGLIKSLNEQCIRPNGTNDVCPTFVVVTVSCDPLKLSPPATCIFRPLCP